MRVGGNAVTRDPTGPGIGYIAENTMAGTKTRTPIMEIQNSIYVFTKQQMVDQQPQTLQEALRYVAGVRTENAGTFGSGSASTSGSILQRGFESKQFVDGLMTNSASAGETAFIERIDVVNGPASVMYGQVNPGGMLPVPGTPSPGAPASSTTSTSASRPISATPHPSFRKAPPTGRENRSHP